MAELADVPVRGEGKAAARMHSQMFQRWQAVFSVVLRRRAAARLHHAPLLLRLDPLLRAQPAVVVAAAAVADNIVVVVPIGVVFVVEVPIQFPV